MSITLLISLGFIVLWWSLRFLPAGVDGHSALPYLIAFIRFLWIPSAIILIIALFSHHWMVALLATLLTGITGIFVSPWYRKRHNAPARRNQPQQRSRNQQIKNKDDCHTVMTLNCRYGLADPQAITDAVRSNGVSVLALQELTQGLVTALDKSGIFTLLPYCQLGEPQESDNGGFNGIFSRTKPEAQAGTTIDIAAADVPYCEVNGVAFYSAHPKSPMRGCEDWAHGIIRLAALDQYASGNSSSAAAPPSEAIVMGDLNSNIDHPSFRRLLNNGLHDAGLSISHGAAASFPQWLIWPRLELDHILTTSGLVTSNVRTLTIPGSDHLALLAEFCNR